MGQLEKYGLYVLCLLIFLIIGVSIWGDPASAASLEQKAPPAKVANVVPDLDKLIAVTKPLASDESGTKLESGGPAAKVEPKTEPKVEPIKSPGEIIAPAPRSDARQTYVIKSGDSYESIARTRYNDASLKTMIAGLNPKLPANKLRIGAEIQLPTAAEVEAKKAPKPVVVEPVAAEKKADAKDAVKAEAKPVDPKVKAEAKVDAKKVATAETKDADAKVAPRTYKISAGDTLVGVSRRMLGSDKRVQEILALNPSIEPSRLRQGQMIRVPAK
jgi:nucleoid-associated protein YgaU